MFRIGDLLAIAVANAVLAAGLLVQAVPASALNSVPWSARYFTENVEFKPAASGDTFQFVVQYTNLGQSTWVKGASGQEARLGTGWTFGDPGNPSDNLNDFNGGWSSGWLAGNRIAAQQESSVLPGANATFTFVAKVPLAAPVGRHAIKAQPLIEGARWLENYGYYQGFDVTAGAGNTPDPTLYSTIYSIGIEWNTSGDANHNATVTVRYRPQGTSPWKAALPLVRVDNAYNGNGFAGSIFFLTPDTTYEVMLSLSEPDGGGASRTLAIATRPLPMPPTGGRTFHVVPGSGGGDGSLANPFKGIAGAQGAARPGDVFLVHAGTYGGRPTFDIPGVARNYIVWKAAGDGEALFADGFNFGASHIWVEGLTVRNQAWATFSLNCPSDVVVSRNFFFNNHYSIYLQRGGEGWYIVDNTIVGDVDPASGSFDGEGIELNGSFSACGANDHTVAHNSITHTADGISTPGANVDIFGNDIFDVADDGIETDEGRTNVRVWGNRIQNAGHNGFSFQPQTGAPWYFIRNQVINNGEDINKYRTWDRAVFLHNTFVHWRDLTYVREDGQLMSISRNNLWISVNGGRMWGLSGSIDWRTDLDYDGFDWGDAASPFRLNGTNHSSLTSFSSATGQERNGVRISHLTCLPTMNVPGDSPTMVPPQYLTLAAGCPAIDAGAILPDINDGFLGAAPDLGAYEKGAPSPVYGPR